MDFLSFFQLLAQDATPEVTQQVVDSAGDVAEAVSSIGLVHYLTVSAISFGLGLLVIITRRNAVAVLMGIELIINAACLNFVAFARHSAEDPTDGQVITLFVIVIAAAEAALALAIILNIFNNLNTVQVDEAQALKG